MTSRLQAKLLAQRALFQRLQSSKKRNKLQAGFTLIELLIVIAIIGILSAIAIPSFLSQRNVQTAAATGTADPTFPDATPGVTGTCATTLTAGTGGTVVTAASITENGFTVGGAGAALLTR
jgi:type IV pilus assembly protein PilA